MAVVFCIALWGEDQDGIFIPGLVSPLAQSPSHLA